MANKEAFVGGLDDFFGVHLLGQPVVEMPPGKARQPAREPGEYLACRRSVTGPHRRHRFGDRVIRTRNGDRRGPRADVKKRWPPERAKRIIPRGHWPNQACTAMARGYYTVFI